MKKVLGLAAICISLISCEDKKESSTVTNSDTTVMNTDTGTVETINTTTTTVYTAADGDVTYRDGKLMRYENGTWVASDKDVTLDDGTVVTVKGEARDRNGKKVKINDGGVINKTGRWFDKAGNAIENAWDDTKAAVKAYGISTLLNKHVKLVAPNKITFDFIGKKGVRNNISIRDQLIYNELRKRKSNKWSDTLFTINSNYIRNYLGSIDDRYVIKDFRTLRANMEAQKLIKKT